MKKFTLFVSMAMLLGLALPQAARCDDGDDDAVATDSGESRFEASDDGQLTPVASDFGHGHGVQNEVHNPEQAHHRYLQSRTGAHAEYTNRWNQYHAAQSPWHGGYAHPAWGRPLALIVPPTADNQVQWGWGVGSTNVVPIYHQFNRGNPATYPPGAWSRFRTPPYWPSNTSQFGVYPVRGPW
jgi:hypothetical protein